MQAREQSQGLLIETMAYEDGIDLYERDANLAMSNLWHHVLPVILGRDRFREVQRLFVELVGEIFDEFRGTKWEEILGLLLASVQRIAARDYGEWGDGHLDPAFPAVVDLGCFWTGRLGAAFDIVHDESKLVKNEPELLELLRSVDHPTELIGYDRRKAHFPIKATGMRLVASEDHADVQLADVVAGAVTYALKKRALRQPDGFADEMLSSRVFEAWRNIVWPTPHVTPAELGTEEVGGVDAVNGVGEFVREHRASAGR